LAIADARSSLARARALHGLTRRALVQAGALADANHHDIALLLSADPKLARELARRLLAPLESIRGQTTRANLESTFREWLGNPGQRKAIAHALGVHPQTIRYRMAKLRELFGGALDDSGGRARARPRGLRCRCPPLWVCSGGRRR
jgi:DNA-binding PucR family transcriptional regulator